ncbi:DegV family protein [Adlercreutzia aquisgranensis]|uniref:DegV family protein n=1 Tax=Adlercreutzia aquisgranensis TaxID=2941323 RepID=UPI00203DFF94|nr:DegV family protein [Adlercreutzia aquisgranensis]
MAANYKIVTDSCSNLLEDTIEQHGLEVLPLTFMVDGEDDVYQSYLKGHTTDLKQFFSMMREGKVFKTSLPTLSQTRELMEGILDGGQDILYIGFSSGLSGTYEATSLLMNELAEAYPDRRLYAVDTLAASGGEGLLVHYAAQMAEQGATIEEVRDWVEEHKLNLAHWFTVDDLMFLFRGGRVSRTSAWAGTLLNIKPILHVDDEGHLIPMEKLRGRKKAIKGLLDHMERTATKPVSEQTVFITHGDCIEDAESLADMIRERFGVKDIVINYIDPVIGAHSGPGTLALFFLADSRN